MMGSIIHTGQKLKDIFRENNLTDESITNLTPFEQSYLSKIYTSREIQPRILQNFLYVINKNFDLNLKLENITDSKTIKV